MASGLGGGAQVCRPEWPREQFAEVAQVRVFFVTRQPFEGVVLGRLSN